MSARCIASSVSTNHIQAMTVDGVAPLNVLMEFARQYEITLTIPEYDSVQAYPIPPPPTGCKTIFVEKRAFVGWNELAKGATKLHNDLVNSGDRPAQDYLMALRGNFTDVPFIMTSTRWVTVLDRLKNSSNFSVQTLTGQIYPLLSVAPTIQGEGHWHLPYINMLDIEAVKENILSMVKRLNLVLGAEDFKAILIDALLRVSASRCARLTWHKTGVSPGEQVEADIEYFKLHFQEKFISNEDVLCHQLTPDTIVNVDGRRLHWRHASFQRNFDGWIPFLETLKADKVFQENQTVPEVA